MNKTSEAQLRAAKKYNEKRKRFCIDFAPTEMELWEQLQKQENKQGYIKRLIREDMSKE
jgi:hypothetical protein